MTVTHRRAANCENMSPPQQKLSIGTCEICRANNRSQRNYDNYKPDIGQISKIRAEKAPSWTPVARFRRKCKYNMDRDIHTYSRNFSFIGPITSSQAPKNKRNLLRGLLGSQTQDRAKNKSRNRNNSRNIFSSLNNNFDMCT